MLHLFCAVVEQQLKKCCSDKLVLGCFLVLGFAASAGCVWKRLGTFGEVCVSVKKCLPFSSAFKPHRLILFWQISMVLYVC